MDIQQIYFKIKHFPAFVSGKYKESGVLPPKKDERDFKVGSFWKEFVGQSYKPLETVKINKTLSIKDQMTLNTCVYNGTCVSKEPDEGVILSVKSMVRYARLKNYLSGNGWSDVRAGMKVLQEFGAMEEKDLPDSGHYNWEEYSTGGLDYTKAAKHKIKSYWSCEDRDDVLKLIDDGRIIGCAMTWYSGFNQSGGFRSPWLIDKNLGYAVGGHFVAIIGYNLNYFGKQVYVMQNSYSSKWGDNGKFYVDMDYMDKYLFGWGSFGAYVHLDVESDIGQFINKYDGKNVKASNKPAIYHIQAGKKKLYPDWATYLAWDGNLNGFKVIDDSEIPVLNKMTSGDNMDITKSVYWQVMAENVKWQNFAEIKKADKNNELIMTLFNLQYKKKMGLPLTLE